MLIWSCESVRFLCSFLNVWIVYFGFGIEKDDIGKIPAHVAMVKNINGLVAGDGICKEHRSHIWSSPWTINGKKSKSSSADTIKMAICVRHHLV